MAKRMYGARIDAERDAALAKMEKDEKKYKTQHGQGKNSPRYRHYLVTDKDPDRDYEALLKSEGCDWLVWQRERDGTTLVRLSYTNSRSFHKLQASLPGCDIRMCDDTVSLYNFHQDEHFHGPVTVGDDLPNLIRHFVKRGEYLTRKRLETTSQQPEITSQQQKLT